VTSIPAVRYLAAVFVLRVVGLATPALISFLRAGGLFDRGNRDIWNYAVTLAPRFG